MIYGKFLRKNKFNDKNIVVHPSTKISRKSEFHTPCGGSVKIGENCLVLDYAYFLTYGGSIELGDHCTVNPFCMLYGQGGLKIGSGVRIAAHTVIIPSNHNFDDPDTPIYRQGLTNRGITIEDDVWIGAGCRILDGVTIGRGCVIGAGSVVTKSLPPLSIAVGVPAKVTGKRGEKK